MILIMNIIYIGIILFLVIARIMNVCKKNEKYEIPGDVIQIVIIAITFYWLLGIVNIYKLIGIFILSVFVKNILNFICKKIFNKKIKFTTENCSECNPYKRFGDN